MKIILNESELKELITKNIDKLFPNMHMANYSVKCELPDKYGAYENGLILNFIRIKDAPND